MGYNTGVLLLNDAIHQLDDPVILTDWWNKVKRIIGGIHGMLPTDASIGNYVNGSTVFHCHHADMIGVYAIGHNDASMWFVEDVGHKTIEDLDLLKKVASRFGYRLIKK